MFYIKTLFAYLVFLFCSQNCHADIFLSKNANDTPLIIVSPVILPDSISDALSADSIKINKKENKKFIAVILSFPVPFGILGLHRIYLGTKPYMPFVYLGTIGGCIGILPLIDFITILSSDKETFKRFENNPRVFLWSH